jgi:hypothetical protein
MKTFCFVTIFCLGLFPSTLIGQDSLKKMKLYNTWVITLAHEKIKHIYTYEINKEDITVVIKDKYEKGKIITEDELTRIAVENINVISFRKKGAIWKAGLIGSAAAFVVIGTFAAVNNSAAHPGEFAENMAVFGMVGAAFTPVGFVVGSAIGSIKCRNKINGDQVSYVNARTKLEKHSLKYYYH